MKKIPKTKTYSSIYNYIYGDGVENIVFRLKELNLDICTAQAWQVFEALGNRKGFDWWWCDLETSLKNEIFNAVVKAIKNTKCPECPKNDSN